jgi:hypothetical protein
MTTAQKFLIACIMAKDISMIAAEPAELFSEFDDLRLRQAILDHYRNYSEIPVISAINLRLGTAYKKTNSTPLFFRDQLRREFLAISISDGLPEIASKMLDEPLEAVELMRKLVLVGRIFDTRVKDVAYSDNATHRMESYHNRRLNGGITYIGTGVPPLDTFTHGYSITDFIAIGGRSGIGKTWLALYLAIELDKHLVSIMSTWVTKYTTRKPVLFISNEMLSVELSERIDCLKCQMPYEDFLSGKLPTFMEERYEKYLKDLEQNIEPTNLVILYSCRTMEDLEDKIRLYDPVAVFIDGLYLFEPSMQEGMQKEMFLSRNTKRIALENSVPIIATVQLRKGTGTKKAETAADGQDDFFYGGLIQDCDAILRGFQTKELRAKNTLGLEFVKGRRLKTGTTLHWTLDQYTYSYGMLVAPSDEEDIAFGDYEEEVSY